jgi:hypothetical protein
MTVTGKVSFRAQRDKEGHADRSWAYMLAIYSAQLPELILPAFGGMRENVGSDRDPKFDAMFR